MDMNALGWNGEWAAHFAKAAPEGCVPARVAQEHRGSYGVYTEFGGLAAEVSGKLLHGAASRTEMPAVGDWVALSRVDGEPKGIIRAVLPRRSVFSRQAPGGRTEEQVIAANVDTVFLVSGLDHDFNVRRIERYLSRAWNSGANPVVVLNKADLVEDVAGAVAEVEAIAIGVPVCVVSAMAASGLDTLREHVSGGGAVAFLGMSGVGKSSLINRLLGEDRMLVKEVRDDDSRGRHKTTHRELLPLPGGGVLIDTPGMRELQLWTDEDSVDGAFADVEALASQCRFRDCAHGNEPGCAVRAAIEYGTLDAGRYQSYQKLQREVRYLERRQDQRARKAEENRWKQIAISHRRAKKGQHEW